MNEEQKQGINDPAINSPVETNVTQPVTPVEAVPAQEAVPQVSSAVSQEGVQPVQGVQNVVPQSTSPVNSKPQVVKVEHTKEVVKEVAKNPTPVQQVIQPQTPPPTNTVPPTETVVEKPRKKGHPIFLIFLMLLLFAFVFFLPEITEYVTNYMNKRNGVEDSSMKSGTMTCSITKEYENLNTTVETVFSYKKNKLQKTSTTTSYRLTDKAVNNTPLTEKEELCERLKNTLSGVSGMSASCSITATVQKTTQDVDYTKLNLNDIADNIAEFEGFYPEYELGQSAVAIRNSMEQAGYTCRASEY